MNKKNQLATDVKTHIIITFTKAHHPITSKQNEALEGLSLDSLIDIDGNKIKGSDIAAVLEMDKYKETYPEKQSANYGQPFTNKDSDMQLLLTDPMERARVMMLKQELDRYQREAVLDKPLDYYGDMLLSDEEYESLLKRNKWFSDKIKARKSDPMDRKFTPSKGYVNSRLLGIVHWSLVKYAVDKNLIRKHSGNNWFIVVDVNPVDNKSTAKRFNDFKFQLQAINSL